MVKQFSEFLNCKTKSGMHLFAIRAFREYNVELEKLEMKLWDELAAYKSPIL
jgi:hypothetical protein